MTPNQDIPLSGSFNCWAQSYDLPDLLLRICRLKQTGELRFMTSEAEKTVVLHNGLIVFAKSSSADDRLGPYLLRTKKIRFEHLTELSRFVTPERRFGAVLVENGVLTPHDLVQGVVGQVRSIILSLFQWTEAAHIFAEKELAKETTNFPFLFRSSSSTVCATFPAGDVSRKGSDRSTRCSNRATGSTTVV